MTSAWTQRAVARLRRLTLLDVVATGRAQDTKE